MPTITYEEQQLMALYNGSGTRAGLIAELKKMRGLRGYLGDEDAELKELTDSATRKLETMSDEDYATLDLFPDFDPEDTDAE